MDTKVCSACEEEKPLTEFYKNKHYKDGFHCHCKSCKLAKERARYRSRIREEKDKYRNRYSSPSGRAHYLLCGAKERARNKEIEVSITREWIEKEIEKGFCSVTGLPFDLNPAEDSSKNPLAPSLDRKDSSKGYTPENTQVVVWIYNAAKSDFTHEDVMKMVNALAGKEVQNNK